MSIYDYEITNEAIDPVDLVIGGRGRKARWPFPLLTVGDVFYVEEKKKEATVRNAAMYWNKKYEGERRFVVYIGTRGLKVQRVL